MLPDKQLAFIAKVGLITLGVLYFWPFIAMCARAWMEW